VLPAEEAEGPGDDRRAVLITGAAGCIGRKLSAAWAAGYELVRIDLHTPPDQPDVVAADLAVWDEAWPALFEGVDVVVHLAANPEADATWAEVEGPNIDATIHVLHAAALAGVGRVIFASSNHAMGGYRHDGSTHPITEDLPPKPDGPYGGTKLMGERLGRAVAATFEMEFVALRLGWNQRGNANRPDTLPDAWSRQLWLSDDDLVRLFTRAVEADLPGTDFVVVNGMSLNAGSRWSQDRARAVLGYEARDDAEAG
jgi:uronate dehydrogenase